MYEEISNIKCRICLQCDLKESKKCLSLFESYNGSSISEKVNSLADVNIEEGDGLPDEICPDCLLQLENAIAFKLKCATSDKILRCKILLAQQSKSNKPQNITETYKIVVKNEAVDVEASFLQDEHSTNYSDIEEKLEDPIDEEDNIEAPVRKSRAIDLKLICDDCGGSFKSKCKLRVHWKKVHMPEKLICPICKRMFKSFRAFNVHNKNKSKSCHIASNVRVEGQGRSRVFHCKECNYKSRRIKDVDSHYITHTGDRRYACQKCSKTFTQQSSLQAHMESSHKMYIVDTTCHLCGKHLQGRGKFYKHMKTHSDQQFQCNVCYKYLKTKSSLSNHMLRHSGVKSYSCEICAASFFTYCELYNHRSKVHMKKRNYKCNLCEYTMYNSTALKKHKAKHTDTNVVCLVCGMFCENSEKLVIHQKRHFNRHIQCPQCDKKFHNRHSLSKHMCKNHRCTLLVEKKEEVKPNYSKSDIKEESPNNNQDEIVVLLSPPDVILK